MKQHTLSFFMSVGVHLLILLSIVYLFSLESLSLEKPQEKRVSLQLASVVLPSSSKKESLEKKSKVKKEKKKRVQKKRTKPIKPKKKRVTRVKKKPLKKVEPVLKPLQKSSLPKQSMQETKREVVQSVKKEELKEKSSTSTPIREKQRELNTKNKPSVQQQYMQQYIQEIVILLQENLYYPRRARKKGIEGEVVVRFQLLKNAEVQNIEVVSSVSKLLSRAAVKTIENLSMKFPKPKEKIVLTVPISYSLEH